MNLSVDQDLLEVARMVIAAFSVIGVFVAAWAARAAARSARAAMESARATGDLVEVERERSAVELQPRFAVECYLTEELQWALQIVNHGPRLVEQLIVRRIGSRHSLAGFSGEITGGDIDAREGRSFSQEAGPELVSQSGSVASDEHTFHDIAVGDQRLLRLARDDDGSAGKATVELEATAAGQQWVQRPTFYFDGVHMRPPAQVRLPQGQVPNVSENRRRW